MWVASPVFDGATEEEITAAGRAIGIEGPALEEAKSRAEVAALKAAAQQFEALFLQMVLKSMRDTLPHDSPFDSDQSRMYQSLLDGTATVELDLGSARALPVGQLGQRDARRHQQAACLRGRGSAGPGLWRVPHQQGSAACQS